VLSIFSFPVSSALEPFLCFEVPLPCQLASLFEIWCLCPGFKLASLTRCSQRLFSINPPTHFFGKYSLYLNESACPGRFHLLNPLHPYFFILFPPPTLSVSPIASQLFRVYFFSGFHASSASAIQARVFTMLYSLP